MLVRCELRCVVIAKFFCNAQDGSPDPGHIGCPPLALRRLGSPLTSGRNMSNERRCNMVPSERYLSDQTREAETTPRMAARSTHKETMLFIWTTIFI